MALQLHRSLVSVNFLLYPVDGLEPSGKVQWSSEMGDCRNQFSGYRGGGGSGDCFTHHHYVHMLLFINHEQWSG